MEETLTSENDLSQGVLGDGNGVGFPGTEDTYALVSEGASETLYRSGCVEDRF